MRRVESGGRDGQKKKEDWGGGKDEKDRKWRKRWTKKKEDWGGGKDEKSRNWRERWTKKKTGDGEG